MKSRPLPIGVEFYKVMIEKNYYYVDKTLLIRDILDSAATVTLFTRPRRFGKTLSLQMLKAFFEDERGRDGSPVDNSRYFEGRKIMSCGPEYTGKLGKYPVISLTLKSARQPSFAMAYSVLKQAICSEFDHHRYVLEGGGLSPEKKEKFIILTSGKGEPADYATALAFLSECLYAYHGRKTVVLIDEYDVPLENAYFRGFYEEMIDFIRSLFESALKTNAHLELAVITGCLRISRESIFTGLNNLEVASVLHEDYGEHFGFTQKEVEKMLAYYGLEGKTEEARSWYNGYLFGKEEVYNPWSVINYVKRASQNKEAFPQPYWSNTSSNTIIRHLVDKAEDKAKKEIEALIEGGTVEKEIHEDVTYGDIYRTDDNLWNFLFFTGYMKAVSRRFEEDKIYMTMKIPNREIRYIYNNAIKEWFEQRVRQCDFTPMYRAMLTGDEKGFEALIREQLKGSISYLDSGEAFYHGFFLGLLAALPHYETLSNREAGEGRSDIILKPYDERENVVILELKNCKRFGEMEGLCEAALAQIEEKHYDAQALDEGYTKFLKYGVCFCKKSCLVRKGQPSG